MNKATVRKEMKSIRSNMNIKDVQSKSKLICKEIEETSAFKCSKNVMIYISAHNEVDLKLLYENNMDKNFFCPYCINKEQMLPARFYGYEEIKESMHNNIFEPKESLIDESCKLDLILVPGIAFDKYKNRIGYGAGYYDRFIKSLHYHVIKIGLGYEFQIVDSIECNVFDMKMDYIITESSFY